MPPRKSNASISNAEEGGGISVEDLSLPRTMVQRLAKGVLPANTSIQKDALLAISKSATVFVNYLGSHAFENAQRNTKKTVQPRDVFDAVHDLEYDDFLPRLEAELTKYNAVQCDKRNSYRRKVREEKQAEAAKAIREHVEGAEEGAEEGASRGRDGEEPASKKVRRSSVEGGDPANVEEDEDDGDTFEDAPEGDEGDGEEEEEEGNDGDEVDEDEHEGADEEDDAGDDSLEPREVEHMQDEALDGDDSD